METKCSLAKLVCLGSVQDRVNFAVAGGGHGQEVILYHLMSLLGARERDSLPERQGSVWLKIHGKGRHLVLSVIGVSYFLYYLSVP